MALTFRKLEVFVAVAEDGNFRRAAERLGISQPSVSSQVKSMERYLGYQLFDRRRGSMSALSPEGRNFLLRARALVSAQNALAEGSQLSGQPHIQLRAAVDTELLEDRVRPGLAAFRDAHPGIDAQFAALPGVGNGVAAIRRGELDILMFTGIVPPAIHGANIETVARLRCSLYGAPALARQVLSGGVAVNELPFLLPQDQYGANGWMHEQLARHGIVPRIAERPATKDSLLQAVLAGRGLSIFFDTEVVVLVRAGRLLCCGPRLEPIPLILLVGARARRPEAAPLLGFLRGVVRRNEQIIAPQQARPDHPRLLAADDSVS